MNEHEYTNTLNKAIELIDAFILSEYDSDKGGNYSDMNRVPIAYTTVGDNNEIDRQAYIDLVNNRIIREDNGEVTDICEYESLDEMIECELEYLDFETLIFG